MPWKDPAVRKQKARERYLLKRDTAWKNPDGSWKKQPKEGRRAWQHEYYAMNKDRINALARDRTKRARERRPTVCAVCDAADSPLVYDHCHMSGAFRGYICGACNLALGHARDNAQILRRLAEYLERTPHD